MVPRNFLDIEVDEAVMVPLSSNAWITGVLDYLELPLPLSQSQSVFVIPTTNIPIQDGGLVMIFIADSLCHGVFLAELEQSVTIIYHFASNLESSLKTSRSRISSDFLTMRLLLLLFIKNLPFFSF